MIINLRKHRITLIVIGLIIVAGASVAPFLSASCNTRPQTPGELKALDTLRTMTRNGVLPAEDVVARIESEYPQTKAAALARMVRARIKIKAGDFDGAAGLLDSSVIAERTAIGDYALLMRAQALEQAGRRGEARAAYEKLARDYPSSTRAREAALRNADLILQDGQGAAAVPVLLKELNDRDDPAALLLTARAYEQASDQMRALAAYRRIYFYAPASEASVEAEGAITRLNSNTSPATAEEAITRANKLYEANRYNDAVNAYTDAFTRFPGTADAQAQLRRGIAASNAKRTTDAVAALNSVHASAGEARAEALFYLAQTYANARQWEMVRSSLEEMRRTFPQSSWTLRAFVRTGQIAEEAKNMTDASYFYRTAVSAYPGAVEVATAQFKIAWLAHEAKNYQESSRLLTEHLALYADKNTDNRGRAGYWAARDSERAGKLAEAYALYQAMLVRYDANWYGYLSKQRLDAMKRSGKAPETNFAPDSLTGRAVANLQTVTVAAETAGPAEEERIIKADQLTNIGAEDWALEELALASQSAPASPRVNLALARIYRARDDNVRALNTLRKSFPDYSQMKPEEMTREEWDVFYPLAYWEIIVQESRAKGLDPHQVAGLIRQESVFIPRARSSAQAYGLMQLLVPTGRLVAKRYGTDSTITAEALYEPRLNIQLGTSYMRDQIDKYGRIEYVAAAYNAGPQRATRWRSTLPAEIDEWVEAIPFTETRGYVQGVVRNTLQYKRLYDENGKFRSEVGSRAVRAGSDAAGGTVPAMQPADSSVRRRRVTGN
ncbi:MAG TPA: transglycosylase SLT domain-containing protein [Pyrinomonadaceae bacterium]|nr:transglycosylase SLT domain-containing protein [Pyrinomonadaceae bacterium]